MKDRPIHEPDMRAGQSVKGGVNQQTATGFILAGASAIGVGAELLPHDAVPKRQDHRIHQLARRFLNFVEDGRTPV